MKDCVMSTLCVTIQLARSRARVKMDSEEMVATVKVLDISRTCPLSYTLCYLISFRRYARYLHFEDR